jgi:hypothetical protein
MDALTNYRGKEHRDIPAFNSLGIGICGVLTCLTILPSLYMVHYLWSMYVELSQIGTDVEPRYSYLPRFFFAVIYSTAFATVCAGLSALFEKRLNPLQTGRLDISTLAFLLCPFPCLISVLGFVYVLAYSGARWGS